MENHCLLYVCHIIDKKKKNVMYLMVFLGFQNLS